MPQLYVVRRLMSRQKLMLWLRELKMLLLHWKKQTCLENRRNRKNLESQRNLET